MTLKAFPKRVNICQLIDMIISVVKTLLREGINKKKALFVVFYYKGGGVGGNVKRLQNFFINHVFFGVFQYVPGPPKHVLHLVWSAYVISTAVRTASKVA